MSKIGLWSTTPSNNNSTPPDGWPEGQAPSTVNDCARQMMADLRTYAQDSQWFDHGFVPTFVGADTFTVPSDKSAFIQAGQRLKLYDAGATIYRSAATVSGSAASTTIVMDAGTAIDTSLSSFAVGILSNTNGVIPRRISVSSIEATALTAGNSVFTGTVHVDGAMTASLITVTGFINSGTYRGKNGTEGAPSLIFDATDTDSGYYWISDGVLGMACNAVQEARLSNAGFVCRAYTVTSDAATKSDWKPIPDNFVARLAAMKAGSFTRIKDKQRSIGVPAQDLQALIPEATHALEDGTLCANYGPAAMISTIALARKIEELTARIAELEAKPKRTKK